MESKASGIGKYSTGLKQETMAVFFFFFVEILAGVPVNLEQKRA